MNHLTKDNPPLLLRVAEAAELLSIARSKAYSMVLAGQLPSVRLGKSVRVPMSALLDTLDRLQRHQQNDASQGAKGI